MPGSLVTPELDLWLFDLDGVLVDTTRCHQRAYSDLWIHVGVNGPPYEEIAGRRTRDVVVEVTAGLAPTESQVREWTQFKQERSRECLAREDIAFTDSADCLRALTRRGTTLGLGTAASRATTDTVLARFGWSASFAVIVTGDDVQHGKPKPDIYLAAMRQSGAAPHRTLVIEDSEAGLAAALAAGAYTAAVRTGRVVASDRFLGTFPDLSALLATLGVEHE